MASASPAPSERGGGSPAHAGVILGTLILVAAVLERTGLLAQIGDRNLLPPDPHLDRSVELALHRGQELLAELRHGDSAATDGTD